MSENKLKKALITFIAYIIIIGTGMYVSYHILGAKYSTPEMFNYFWITEIILSILVVFVTFKYFSLEEVGLSKRVNKKQLLWILPSTLIIVLIIVGEITSITQNGLDESQIKSLMLIGGTTILVGFSEELMFRGIILNTALKNYGKLKAIFISSLAFGLLHTVNVLAGLSFSQMIFQFVLTSIFGLLFALIYIRINNILPLMVFHFLWDFSLISETITGYTSNIPMGYLTITGILIEVVLILILLKKNNSNISNDNLHLSS